MAKLRHDALYSLKSATAHADRGSQGNIRVGPQQAAARQPVADSVDLLGADRIALAIAQEANHTGRGDDGELGMRRETDKHIPREKRAIQDDGPVSPF